MSLFAVAHDTVALLLLGLWLASALWVYTDAHTRFERPDRPAQLLVAALLLPFGAAIVYACLRPGESVLDRRERQASRRLLEAALADGERCLVCRLPVEGDFLCCPGCATELRRPCRQCAEPLRLHWSACPHCAHEVEREPSPLRLVA